MNRPRQILIAGSSQGVYGGIEVFMLALGEYLNSLPGVVCKVAFKLVKGYEIQSSLQELIDQSNINAYILKRGSTQMLQLIAEADLVHMQNFPPDILFPALLMGKPTVSTQHNWKRGEVNAHQILWNIAHKTVHFITYNSDFVARSWENGKTSGPRAHVIPTVSRFSGEPPDFENERMGFCFISRWIGNKGADLLIRAYAKANINRKNWPLFMMGSGPLLNELKAELKANPIEGLEIMGRVEETTKYDVIRSSKWIIVPPECLEDMGLTPIEGRLLGVPAIASNIGGVPESAGRHALFFKSGNETELSQLLEQASLMEESEYLARCHGCYESLKSYLKPLDVYYKIYQKLLNQM